MSDDEIPECPGAGFCHGCLEFCSVCGDVRHVCDTRLRNERCDEHPVPPTRREILLTRRAAEKAIRDGARVRDAGLALLNAVADQEHARDAYNRQLNELREQEERKAFGVAK